jgi:hypothetical protein
MHRWNLVRFDVHLFDYCKMSYHFSKNKITIQDYIKCTAPWFIDEQQKNCYMVNYQETTWQHAKSVCKSEGATLTAVDNQKEANLILCMNMCNNATFTYMFAAHVNSNTSIVWIGGRKVNENDVEWTDGTQAGYKNWAAGN